MSVSQHPLRTVVLMLLWAALLVVRPDQAAAAGTPLLAASAGKQASNWKAAEGMSLSQAPDGSIKLTGTQAGGWNYARISLNEAGLKPGAFYVLKAMLRVESLEDKRYSPFLKVGLSDKSGKELPAQVTKPYDTTSLGLWQRAVLRFKMSKSAGKAFLAVEKGSSARNAAILYVKDVSIELAAESKGLDAAALGRLKALNGQHPRLYLKQQDIARIKSRLSTQPYQRLWGQVKERADRYARETPPATSPGDGPIRELGNKLPFLSFGYLLTGDAKYLKAVRTWMDALCAYPNWADNNDLGPSHLLVGMAIAYDWLYPQFTPAEREKYRTKMAKHAGILHGLLVNQSIWWAKDLLHNHNWVDAGSIGIAGLALYGEQPEALDWINASEENFEAVLPVLPPDGSWYEGVPYWGYGMEALLKYFVAMEPVYGLDRVKKHPFFQNGARFRLHMSLPGFAGVIPYSDAPETDWYGPGYMLRKLASLNGDGTAQWLADKVDAARGSKSLFDWHSWLDLLWYDDTVKPLPADAQPRWAHFADLGLYVRRSDWTSAATLSFFKAGPPQGSHAESLDLFVTGHAHPDAGTFLQWFNGEWLLPDDGYLYTKFAANHNILLFNGFGQLGEGGTWFDEKGLARLFAGTAKIDSVTSQPGYSLVSASLGKLFHPRAGVKTWNRSIAMLDNGILVVRDRVEMAPGGTLESFLHFADGNTAVEPKTVSFTGKATKAATSVFSASAFDSKLNDFTVTGPKNIGTLAKKRVRTTMAVNGPVVLTTVIVPAKAAQKPVPATLVGAPDKDVLRFNVGGKEYTVDFGKKTVTGI